jgi:hypothetical protein
VQDSGVGSVREASNINKELQNERTEDQIDDAPTVKNSKTASPSKRGKSAASGENVEAGTETQGKKVHT